MIFSYSYIHVACTDFFVLLLFIYVFVVKQKDIYKWFIPTEFYI